MNDQSAGMEDGHIPVAAPERAEPLILTDALPPTATPSRVPARRARRGRGGISLTVILTLVLLALGFGYLTLAYTGRTIRLPTWTVAEIEARMNAGLDSARLPKGTAVSLGGVELAVAPDFVPRFRIEDIRLIEGNGRSLLALPEALLAFDPKALLTGKIRPSEIRLSGARLAVRRDMSGRIDLEFDGRGVGPKSSSEVLTAVETLFASPALAALSRIEAEGLRRICNW